MTKKRKGTPFDRKESKRQARDRKKKSRSNTEVQESERECNQQRIRNARQDREYREQERESNQERIRNARQDREYREQERESNQERMRNTRENREYCEQERESNQARMRNAREDREYREQERESNQARMRNAREDREYREQERESNQARMRNAREDREYHEQERESNQARMRNAREDREYREQERESNQARMRNAREDREYHEQERESNQARMRNAREDREYREQERESNQARMRRNAVHANEGINFETSITDEWKCGFHSFEQDPEEAVMLWHLNSGSLRFSDVNGDLNDAAVRERLANEIHDEILTVEEQDNLVGDFLLRQGRGGYNAAYRQECSIKSCGACGKHEAERNGLEYVESHLSQLGILKLNEEQRERFQQECSALPLMLPIDDLGELKEFHVWKLRSIYAWENSLYFLHPELIHQVKVDEHRLMPATYLCKTCNAAVNDGQIPSNSLASGVDFGDCSRLPLLTRPNQMERAIIAKLRHYYTIVKVQPNGQPGWSRSDYTHSAIRGHAILFEHDAPKVAASSLLSREHMQNAIGLHFLGPDGYMDQLIQNTLGTSFILGRAYVIYQWLAILNDINWMYENEYQLPAFEDLKQVIKECNEHIVKTAVRVTNADTLRAEAHIGDDVAKVRTTTSNHNREETASDRIDSDVALTFSLVTNVDKTGNAHEDQPKHNSVDHATVAVLRAAANVLEVDVDGDDLRDDCGHEEEDEHRPESMRSRDPVTIYGRSDYALAAAFPDVFLYGSAYGREVGILSKSQTEHLLLQFTNVPATCRELIFYLFDQQQIVSNILGVSAKVKSDPKAFDEMARMILSDKFKSELKHAIQNPKSRTAQLVLNKIMPVLTVSGKHTLFGAVEKNIAVSKFSALSKRCGPGSMFGTIAPNDISNPTSFRLTFRSCNNDSFPSVAPEEFFDAMQMNSDFLVGEGNIRVPCGYSARAKAAVRNPVATVMEYKTLLDNIMSCLIKRDPTSQASGSKTVRTKYYMDAGKGIFGHILALYGGNEAQARAALHMHFVLYGGLTPKLLQGVASCQELCDEVSKALDTMYRAELPREVHAYNLLEGKMKITMSGLLQQHVGRHVPPALKVPPSPASAPDKWLSMTYQNGLQLGIHKHTFTCYKGPTGYEGCRGFKPSGDVPSTRPVQLKSSMDDEGNPDYTPMVCDDIDERPNPSTRDIRKEPIPKPDERCIVWELKRPLLDGMPVPSFDDAISIEQKREWYIFELCNVICDPNGETAVSAWLNKLTMPSVESVYQHLSERLPDRNGWIVEYNPVLTNVTGSHCAMCLLGNTTQSNASLFYIAPYIGKNKASLEQCMSVLLEAYHHVEKYPSVAEDSGTDRRTVQHIVTRVLNSLNVQMEITDTQAVAALLGIGSEITSEVFAYYGAHDAVKYLHHELSDMKPSSEWTDAADSDMDSDRGSLEDFIADDDDCNMSDGDSNSGILEDFTVDDNNCDTSNDGSTIVNDHGDNEAFAIACPPGIDVDTGSGLGAVKLYKLENDPAKKIPVPYAALYRYRGKALRHLTRHEYYALVQVKPYRGSDEENKVQENVDNEASSRKTGRKKSRAFDFGKGSELQGIYRQYLKSKQPVLIFSSPPPPPHPGPPPENKKEYSMWLKRANEFAEYYLLAFREEPNVYDGDCTPCCMDYDWNALVNFVKELEASDRLIDKYRLEALKNQVYGMHSTYQAKVMMAKYRGRHRTIWTEQQRSVAQAQTDANAQDYHFSQGEQDIAELIADQEFLTLSSSSMRDALKEICYTDAQRNKLSKILSDAESFGGVNDAKQAAAHTENTGMSPMQHTSRTPVLDINPNYVISTAMHLKQGTLPVVENNHGSDQNAMNNNSTEDDDESENDSIDENWHIPLHLQRTVDDFIQSSGANEEQTAIVNAMATYLVDREVAIHNHMSMPEIPIILVTGTAGTGKSHVTDTIQDLAEFIGAGHVAPMSYNGIAAVNIGGLTLCSLFSYGYRLKTPNFLPPLDDQALIRMRNALKSKDLCLVIVDEVSTCTATEIAILDERLKQVMGEYNLPFGGVAIMFVGDFFQMKPVGEETIPTSMMHMARRWLHAEQATTTRNTTQEESTGDAHSSAVPLQRHPRKSAPSIDGARPPDEQSGKYQFNGLVEKGCKLFARAFRYNLTEQMRSTDPGHTSFVERIGNGGRITMEDLRQYKPLTSHDIVNDPTWKFTPVLVATNRERIDIIEMQAQAYARDHGTHVFRWPLPRRNWKSKPAMIEEALQDPCFWGFFVANADGFLLRNHEQKDLLPLANGTPVLYHSLTFSTEEETNFVQEEIKTLPAGSVITLDRPPLSVNIVPWPENMKQREKLRPWSMCEPGTDVVIPILPDSGGQKWKQYPVRGGLSYRTLPSKVQTRRVFPLELAFAITIHKAQGRNMKKVILALESRPLGIMQMEFPSIFVAMSRVKERENIRILFHSPAETADYDKLRYITRLKPSKNVLRYYAGFHNNRGLWDPARALSSHF